ncbi:MAG TPA: PQQ-dependent sugar dehydrogenase [Caulobacteraceae bacterium]|nr:PQQ-dependent sugar dehydrogenase [Caulobacteraceae bacterium]
MRRLILCLAMILATGPAALAASPFDDWRADAPGVTRRYEPAQIPPPRPSGGPEAADVVNPARIVRQIKPPRAPPGFQVRLFASGLARPRALRTAPDGDVFVAETGSGRILYFPKDSAKAKVFATGLSRPYGIGFWPPGPAPRFVYVGEPTRVVRFPYRPGAPAAGPAQTIVPGIPGNHHWTRDLAVAPDGKALFVAIGSGSNEAGDMQRSPPGGVAAFAATHPLGEAWGPEVGRAQVRVFDPDGRGLRTWATGLRNCSGITVQPGTGSLWCAVNERDGLGDNTPPDYVTAVRRGAFYGWPWFYIGDHPDPRIPGRPDLKDKVTVPEVLLQAHTAPLGIVFYDGAQFPARYRGDAFVAEHGSWNRTRRVGYKVVRVRFSGGRPTGAVEDFLTGFVISDAAAWGRPVGVTVAADGALLVSEDASGTIWRISWTGAAPARGR